MQDIETSSDIDFDDLLARIRDGDQQAENSLVKRFWRGLYFILFRQTGDQELSRDLAQDALILVVARAREGAIEHPKALSAYIRKVGENKLIGFKRKQARQKTDAASDMIDSVADESESLIARVRESQVGKYVDTLLSELKHDRDREILKRHYLLGDDKQSICDALQLSKAQADVVLHRARERLKSLILQRDSDGKGPKVSDILGGWLLVVSAAQGILQASHFTVECKRICLPVFAPHGVYTGICRS